MNKKNLFALVGLVILMIEERLSAQYTTLTVSASATSNTGNFVTQSNSVQFVVPTNVMATIIHLHGTTVPIGYQGSNSGGAGYLAFALNGLNFTYTESFLSNINNKLIVVGPATITLAAIANVVNVVNNGPATLQDNMLCLISTNMPDGCNPNKCATNNFIPNTGVVIPSDATGPVQIILQSSSDLINWMPSLPGTYGNTYSNRFFRVIAVAQ